MKRQKLFYIPGLISLFCLPMLLLLCFPKPSARHTVIRLFVPSDKKPPPGIHGFSKYEVLREVSTRHMISIELEKDIRFDRELYNYHAKMQLIYREIERITYTHETHSVLKVHFGDTSTYGDFVSILNHINICGVKRYALIDNDLYIFANELPAAHAEITDPHPIRLLEM